MTYKAKIDDKSFRGNTWVLINITCIRRNPLKRCENAIDSYMIQQYFGFIKALKIPTRQINWFYFRYPSPNKQ